MHTRKMKVEAPSPMPLGVNDVQAVNLCRDWMVHLGAVDTVATAPDVQRTCDLYSHCYLAWVDNRRGNLEEDAILDASQVAVRDGRQALIFVRGGVFPEAQARADSLGIAIFVYRAIDGSLDGANALGARLRNTGLKR